MANPEQYIEACASVIAVRTKDSVGPWTLLIYDKEIKCMAKAELRKIRYIVYSATQKITYLINNINEDDIRIGFTLKQWDQLSRKITAAQKKGLLP